jgi:hypothetical protein
MVALLIQPLAVPLGAFPAWVGSVIISAELKKIRHKALVIDF